VWFRNVWLGLTSHYLSYLVRFYLGKNSSEFTLGELQILLLPKNTMLQIINPIKLIMIEQHKLTVNYLAEKNDHIPDWLLFTSM
jgi:hypothetical protein